MVGGTKRICGGGLGTVLRVFAHALGADELGQDVLADRLKLGSEEVDELINECSFRIAFWGTRRSIAQWGIC